MKSKSEQGLGAVRAVKNRKTNAIVGYRALLPREHSTPPKGVKNPEKYQEPIPKLCETEDEARALLNAVLTNLREKKTLRHGLTFSHYSQTVLNERKKDFVRKYGNQAKANKKVASFWSIHRRWFKHAAWFDWTPETIEHKDVQHFFNWLRDQEGASGEPLSGNWIHQVHGFVKAIFERADIHPNPAVGLKLPERGEANIDYLDLQAQRRLFAADKVSFEDRLMVGCGMGAGLRVGELLSIEVGDVHLDVSDPHLIIRYGGPKHSPPKGKRVRRVELFDPGLGFWRLWMRSHHAGGERVFMGANGGYLYKWPDKFPDWAALAGKDWIGSHIMRHTYAVAMLSGLWGYEPQTLEFVSKQLGHAEVSTTERYYAAYAPGVWQKNVRQMTGREVRKPTAPVGVAGLLGADASVDASPPVFPGEFAKNGTSPRWSKNGKSSDKIAPSDAPTHQQFEERRRAFLKAAAAGDPTALAQAVELLRHPLPSTLARGKIA